MLTSTSALHLSSLSLFLAQLAPNMTVICILSQQLWHLVFHAFINFVVRQRCLIECHQVGGSFLLFFFAVFYSVSVFALSTKQFLLSLPVRISAVLVVEEARYPRVQKSVCMNGGRLLCIAFY